MERKTIYKEGGGNEKELMSVCVLTQSYRLFETLWTIVCQAPSSMGFSRQEYWSGLLYPPPGDLLNPGIKPILLCLLHEQTGSLPLVPPGKPVKGWQQTGEKWGGYTSGLHIQGETRGLSAYHFLSLHPLKINSLTSICTIWHLSSTFPILLVYSSILPMFKSQWPSFFPWEAELFFLGASACTISCALDSLHMIWMSPFWYQLRYQFSSFTS